MSALPQPGSAEPSEVRAKRERRKEARPGELLDAALDLFVEKGFAATRAEEVAARAGVSKGTLFLYFPSKEELFKALVRETIAGRFAEWNQEFATFPGSTRDMVRYAIQMWWERVGATRASGITKLMMSEAKNFPEIAEFYRQEVINPGHELMRRIIQRGIDRGEFQVADVDYAVYSIVAPMIFITMSQHTGGMCVAGGHELKPQAFIDSIVAILLDGLSVRPTGAAATQEQS